MGKEKYCILCHISVSSTGYHGKNTSDDDDTGNGINSESKLSGRLTSTYGSSLVFGEINENEDIQLINSFYRGIQIGEVGLVKLEALLDCGGNGDVDIGHGDQLSLCKACRPVLTSTMERKGVLDKVEENVRKMQVELLKELTKLKGLVHQFYEDIKGVEERIGSGRFQNQCTSMSPCNSFEVETFERRIRQVVKELSSCQAVNQLQIPEDTYPEDDFVSLIPEDIVKLSLSPPSAPAPQCLESDEESMDPSSDEDSSHGNRKSKTFPKNLTNRKPDKNNLSSSYSQRKSYVIEKVLLRKKRILSGKPLPRKPRARTDVPDPRDAYYIDYNPTTDTFSIDGLSIILTITSQNTFNFNCSQCPFITGTGQTKTKEKLTPFLEIWDHVLRLHRQIFQCGFCARICSSLSRYREHVRGHQLKYVCDICQRPLQTRKNLELHKWTHLNEEEREQAIKNGGKDPKLIKNKISGNIFQCSTCGKGFKLKGNLKLHEKTHLSDEDRKRICDNCGKAVNNDNSSWSKHRKYFCKLINTKPTSLIEGEVKFECLKCDKSFGTVELRRRHVRRSHPERGGDKEGKRVSCEVCGKGFGSKSGLKVHLESHREDRPWECGSGCGMRFKQKGVRRKHEKCCDGSGTRPGPKKMGDKSTGE